MGGGDLFGTQAGVIQVCADIHADAQMGVVEGFVLAGVTGGAGD